MFSYLRNIPNRDLDARRRFVVAGTIISFVIILLLWAFLRFVFWKSSPSDVEEPLPTESPVPEVEELGTGEEGALPGLLDESFLPTPSVTPGGYGSPSPDSAASEPALFQPPASPLVPEASPDVSPDPFPTL